MLGFGIGVNIQLRSNKNMKNDNCTQFIIDNMVSSAI